MQQAAPGIAGAPLEPPGQGLVGPPGTAPPFASEQPGAGAGVKVGVLVPLSGASAAVGRGILDAGQMALFDVAESRVELLPRDTKGDPKAAADAAKAVIGEGARLIIGPLLASEVEAVKPVAQAARVPVIAFSTATRLAGDGVYLMGFLPGEEVARVAAYAQSQGRGHFGVLAPRGAYGELAVASLRTALEGSGGTIADVEYFDGGIKDMAPVVRRFATAARGMDALLLPEGGGQLKTLAPLLPYYDIDPKKVKLLGPGLWDVPGLGQEPALEGGW